MTSPAATVVVVAVGAAAGVCVRAANGPPASKENEECKKSRKVVNQVQSVFE